MKLDNKILITGGSGLVGSSIINFLKKKKYKNLLFPSSKKLNLLDYEAVDRYIKKNKPNYVFAAAAKVGGIEANIKYSNDFLVENTIMQNNLIMSCHYNDVNNFMFFGSSCIYPKLSKQPIKEEYLLSGELEETNELYALAKISGLKLCQNIRRQFNRNYVCVMPTNLYGRKDSYGKNKSHVIPAIIKKVFEAKIKKESSIELFGTGKALREFLHAEDLARACELIFKKNKNYSLINIGSGKEISIKNLALLVASKLKHNIKIDYNINIPDGTPRKILDSSKIRGLGWKPKVSLEKGLEDTIKDYRLNYVNL